MEWKFLPHLFTEFQDMSEEARELALARVKEAGVDVSRHRILFEMKSRFTASNDNDTLVVDQADAILMSDQFTQMLLCWEECDKDMLVAKLTYEKGQTYGTS